MTWDGELQIYAMHQNENIYRERWQMDGKIDMPFFGGFAHAADGFARTESPRRLKPVNIYYHWYSGDNLVALRAVTHLYDWASEQLLHSMRASDYARLVRDCRTARIFQTEDSSYLLISNGFLRSWRLSSTSGFPDIQSSLGVTGYRRDDKDLYVHTDGSSVVRLALKPSPANNALFLVSSTADMHFEKFSPKRLDFSTTDLRPVNAVFGGGGPNNRIKVQINHTLSESKTDEQGQFRLLLPEQTRASLEVIP
jgi:hypothetical protein